MNILTKEEQVKLLEEQKAQIQKKIGKLSKALAGMGNKKKELEKRYGLIQKDLNRAMSDVTITEHAILRYFERELGFDLDEIRKRILPEEIKDKITTLNCCKYPVNGFTLIIQNNKVVTLYKTAEE